MAGQRQVEDTQRRYGFVLAGGGGRRMGGADKGEALLDRRRLVDRVVSRLAAQVDCLALCGKTDYGTGLPVVRDRDKGPKGPAAGIYAAHHWMRARAPDGAGFFTVPVDGPFLPGDLIIRLLDAGGSAFAADAERDHPTFAYWTPDALERAWGVLAGETSLSMLKIAETCGARRVVWDDPYAFFNVNGPDDLKTAETILCAHPELQ